MSFDCQISSHGTCCRGTSRPAVRPVDTGTVKRLAAVAIRLWCCGAADDVPALNDPVASKKPRVAKRKKP